MLTVRFVFGKAADDVCAELLSDVHQGGANFVLYDEDEPIGLWRMQVNIADGEAVGEISDVVFKDGVEYGDKMFFRHAMMFELLEGERMTLRLSDDLSSDEFEALKKFGFELNGAKYELDSKKINLYYNCGGRI